MSFSDFTNQWFEMISNPLELGGAVTGFLCVWLAAKENIWNWPIGLISVALYAVLFYQSALYSDALLQIIFAIFQIYGWRNWFHKKKINSITTISNDQLLKSLAFLIFLWAAWYFVLIKIKPNASLPLWDSLTTCISLIAIYLQAKKKIENWIFWVVADIIYIPMYIQKNLFLTATLYALFLGLAAYGYIQWRRILSNKIVV